MTINIQLLLMVIKVWFNNNNRQTILNIKSTYLQKQEQLVKVKTGSDKNPDFRTLGSRVLFGESAGVEPPLEPDALVWRRVAEVWGALRRLWKCRDISPPAQN